MEPALISLDITPKTPADQQKLARALQVLAAEDTELRVSPGAGSDGTVIGATSEAHLERTVDRLRREFQVEASVPLSELFGFEWQLRAETHGPAFCSIRFAYYQPVVQGPAGDDDHTSGVGAPRRPAP